MNINAKNATGNFHFFARLKKEARILLAKTAVRTKHFGWFPDFALSDLKKP